MFKGDDLLVWMYLAAMICRSVLPCIIDQVKEIRTNQIPERRIRSFASVVAARVVRRIVSKVGLIHMPQAREDSPTTDVQRCIRANRSPSLKRIAKTQLSIMDILSPESCSMADTHAVTSFKSRLTSHLIPPVRCLYLSRALGLQ